MPRGDKRGPSGMGPGTGRAMGFCAGFDSPGYANPGPGFGRGFGRGLRRGFGFRRDYIGYAQPVMPTKEQEMADLKAERDALHQDLKEIDERLKATEKKK